MRIEIASLINDMGFALNVWNQKLGACREVRIDTIYGSILVLRIPFRTVAVSDRIGMLFQVA